MIEKNPLPSFRARGTSMLPSIFPGCDLFGKPLDRGSLRVGDIVGYPSAGPVMAAHRIVEIRDENTLVVKGDAQRATETINSEAVALKITKVAYGRWHYDVDRPLGKLFKHLSLGNGSGWRAAVKCSLIALRLKSKIENLAKGNQNESP